LNRRPIIVCSPRKVPKTNTNSLGKEVDYQGSRQIDNFSRRYYEKELGAGAGPSLSGSEMFGYTEPFRRFVQHETFSPQANEIPNTAASWLPGDDYYTNFHEGDPFIKIDEGYARLPGAGYAALHPELRGVDPEDYPDIHRMAILADVAPYSREYNTYRQRVGAQAQGDTELEIEYEKILNRVKQTRESVIRMQDRHFTTPVDEIAGTVEEASPGGVTLKEYPGRLFQFSSVSTSAADMSARILGENNNMTRCLRPAGHKTPHARAPDRSPIQETMDPGSGPGHFQALSSSVQGRQARMGFPSCRHPETPRVQAPGTAAAQVFITRLESWLFSEREDAAPGSRGCPHRGKSFAIRHVTFFRRPLA
jgi:hypothetical protein